MAKKNKKEYPNGKLPYTQQLKQLKKESQFWERFGFTKTDEIPTHVNHIDLRCSKITDDELGILVSRINSVNMLDLNDTGITCKGIEHLAKLEHLSELRLKECSELNDDCIPFLNQLTTLTLLHVKSTNITIDGILKLDSLTNLETLLFSADSIDAIRDKLERLSAMLPKCELIVDGIMYRNGE
jgi:hypothetical protein